MPFTAPATAFRLTFKALGDRGKDIAETAGDEADEVEVAGTFEADE